MNAPLAEMLRYNHWANVTLFEACRALVDAHLDVRAPGGANSVRELVTHIARGQQTIALRAIGGEQSSWSEWPGFDAVLDMLARSNDELIAIANSHGEDTSVDLLNGSKPYRFPISFLLIQALAHGVEHRTEIKLALASVGVTTPDLDSWSYAAAGWARNP